MKLKTVGRVEISATCFLARASRLAPNHTGGIA